MKKLIAASLVLFVAAPVFAQVSTQGTGVVYAKPDCAHLSFVVVTEHVRAAKAHAQNKVSSDAFFAVLKRGNVGDKDVSTTHFDISPKYHYPKDAEPKLVGYVVSHHLSVKVRDLKGVGSLIDGAITDNVRLRNIGFVISDRASLEANARDLALADAKKKANQLVTGLGERLGKLVSVSESVPPHRNVVYGMSPDSRVASATQVASGEQAVTVLVDAVWDVSGGKTHRLHRGFRRRANTIPPVEYLPPVKPE